MRFILAILLILQFATRGPRWSPFESAKDSARGVILKAEQGSALLVVICKDRVPGIMVALPDVTGASPAEVRLRWGNGALVYEDWTGAPGMVLYPNWQKGDHLAQLEKADRLAVEFRDLGWGEFDLSEKRAALEVIRACRGGS